MAVLVLLGLRLAQQCSDVQPGLAAFLLWTLYPLINNFACTAVWTQPLVLALRRPAPAWLPAQAQTCECCQ